MRVNRNIRNTDEEWRQFRECLGTDNLRILCADLDAGKTELVRGKSGVLEIKKKK